MFRPDAGHQHSLLALSEQRRNLHDLARSFSLAIDHFGKTLAQRPMQVNLGKAQVCHWLALERPQNAFATDIPSAKLFQQRDGFRCGHLFRMPRSKSLRQSLAGAVSMMVMPEESMAILKKIPDDHDVENKNHEHPQRERLHEGVDFDRDEKR